MHSDILPKALIASSIGIAGWFTDADDEDASQVAYPRRRSACWRAISASSGIAPISKGFRAAKTAMGFVGYGSIPDIEITPKGLEFVVLGAPNVGYTLSYNAIPNLALLDIPYAANVDWVLSTSNPIIETTSLVELAPEVVAQLDALRSLERNWDGYGASPLEADVLDTMQTSLLAALQGIEYPAPDLIPGADGSLAAEWHRDKVELIFNVERDGSRSLSIQDARGSHEYRDEEAVARLQEYAARLD